MAKRLEKCLEILCEYKLWLLGLLQFHSHIGLPLANVGRRQTLDVINLV